MFHGKGLIIDKEKNRYKKYVSVLFFEVGDWESLPSISFVAITKVKGSQKMHSRGGMGASATLRFDMYCVYLCLDKKQKVLVKKTKNMQEASRLAEGAAEYLGIDLKNYVKED